MQFNGKHFTLKQAKILKNRARITKLTFIPVAIFINVIYFLNVKLFHASRLC